MAGYSSAVKLNNMVTTSLTTLGNGISSFTAQNLGAAALLFTEMIPQFQKLGTVYAESNPELIDNYRIQALWGNFDKVLHKRRAVFAKEIDRK